MKRSAEAGKSGDPLPNNSSGGKAARVTADAVDPGVERQQEWAGTVLWLAVMYFGRGLS